MKEAKTNRVRLGKHRVVSQILDDLLSRSSPGGKLPGIRKIMIRSGCGRPVVEKELHKLVEAGRLVSRDRDGFYKAEPSGGPRRIVLLYDGLYPDPMGDESFTDLLFDTLRSFAEKEVYQLDFVQCGDMDTEELPRLAGKLGTDKLILHQCKSREFAVKAGKLFRFCMELLPRHDTAVNPELRDSPEMTSLQLNYLFQRNYRKIGCLHHVENEYSQTPTQYHRLFDYYRIMAEHGNPVNPAWVLYAPWEWKPFEKAMEKAFSKDIPEAVIVPGSSLEFFYRFCGNRGIAVGKDIGVMACDLLFQKLNPQVTAITNDPVRIAEDAWQVMTQCLAGTVLHLTTKLNILTGKTVLKLNGV